MMKSLKFVMVMAAFLAGGILAEAHHIKAPPRNGTVVVKLHRPQIAVHAGHNYYYADGIWYRPRGRKYVVVAAPIGVRIKRLPRGYRIVRVNGTRYYMYKGVWYSRSGRYYTVVRKA